MAKSEENMSEKEREKKFRRESDARTLKEAAEIMDEPKRLKGALDEIDSEQKELSSMKDKLGLRKNSK